MKRNFFKRVAVVLVLVMVFSMLAACNSSTTNEIENVEEENMDSSIITIEADGEKIVIEDAEGKTAQQLLNEAGITLKDGDVLSISPDQVLTGDMTIQVLRRCAVVVVVAADDPLDDIQYTAVLVGGTVADAIEAVGIKLADNQTANYELEKALEDGMEIIISEKEEVEDEPIANVDNSSSNNSDSSSESSSGSGSSSSSSSGSGSGTSSGSGSGTSSGSGSGTSSGSGSGTSSGSGSGTGSGSSSGTGSGSESGRTVVNVEIYEDCDGSGHGVKVITYSDGTQEEVQF